MKQKLLGIAGRVSTFPKGDIGVQRVIEKGSEEGDHAIRYHVPVSSTDLSMFFSYILTLNRAERSVSPWGKVSIELPLRSPNSRVWILCVVAQMLLDVIVKYETERFNLLSGL